MEKDHNNYHSDEAAAIFPTSYNNNNGVVEYSELQHHHEFGMIGGEGSGESSHNHNNNGMVVNYMLNPPPSCSSQQQQQEGFYGCSFDKLSFADVMQLADFGPKLGIHQTHHHITNNNDDDDDEEEEKLQEDQEGGMDPVLFLKFPVLNDKSLEDNNEEEDDNNKESGGREREMENDVVLVEEEEEGDKNMNNMNNGKKGGKRKRGRSIKTSEEVESQRMTHIAVERNRRKQMNEHLRVLRSLMPGSYVQRGDQASIIGGAIEFVRELEQLLQCLESQKRRRVLGDSSSSISSNDQGGLFLPSGGGGGGDILIHHNNATTTTSTSSINIREETAENKSCVADVEVKVIGFDAMIKILSRRRPSQLIKTIAALQDLHLIILHTNITTIEQTVLYSFNVKVATDSRFTAQDLATSVQHIFSFIHDNTGI